MAGLKPAARSFVRTAFAELEPKVKDKQAEPGLRLRWERAGAELFVLRPPVVTPEEWCLIDEERHLADLPEATGFENALRNDTRFGPLLGKLVGTALAAVHVDESTLRRELLWAVMRAGNTSLEFSDDAFERGYETWLRKALARTQEGVALAPVSLHFDGSLDLGDRTEITQLTDEEVSVCLNMGAIRVTLPTPGSDTAWVRNRTAIRLTYQLPRGPQEGFTEDDVLAASASEKEAHDRADEVVEALRVFESGKVALTGLVLLRGDGSMSGGSAGAPRVPEAAELTLSDPEGFRAFWQLFRATRANPAISVVTRRFSYAGERMRPDDEIVDLIAALEALLLSEIPERGELRFRTALRGALFIGGSGLTRRQIQTQLRRGYDVRSAVAHGGTPSDKHLRSPTGTTLTLDEFVDEIEELVRLAVRRAVEAVGAGNPWPPDWDALTLEGVSYPS